MVNIYWTPGTVLNTFHVSSHLILTATKEKGSRHGTRHEEGLNKYF